MNTKGKNKAIAKWLGIEIYDGGGFWDLSKDDMIGKWQPDKCRNQQKLIEDKLIEIGYDIIYHYPQNSEKWTVIISTNKKSILTQNKSKDTAFINAVIELISD